MNAHPLAELVPEMRDTEYRELVADIEANGLQEPLTLYEGLVLDGRHRGRACEELGVEPATREFDGNDPARFVISMNVRRRHLTTGQLADIALAAIPHLRDAYAARQGTAKTKRSSAQMGTTPESFGKAREEAAATVGVGHATVGRLKVVADLAPDLHDEVRAGKKTVGAAYTETKDRQNGDGESTVSLDTPRMRALARAQKQRLEKAVGTCSGLMHAHHINVAAGVALSTPEEIAGWDEAFRGAMAAIKRLRAEVRAAT